MSSAAKRHCSLAFLLAAVAGIITLGSFLQGMLACLPLEAVAYLTLRALSLLGGHFQHLLDSGRASSLFPVAEESLEVGMEERTRRAAFILPFALLVGTKGCQVWQSRALPSVGAAQHTGSLCRSLPGQEAESRATVEQHPGVRCLS